MGAEAHEHHVAGAGDLRPGRSLTFRLECQGRTIEAFVVNYEGTLHAYVNQCRHVPMTLDWVENQFFTEDGRYLVCATHGAYYEPHTGMCVDGPPCGRALFPIPLRIEGDRILARCPADLPV
jgi:nitrite reductase/ring-hydroxylating ferredoxin subunit